MESNSSPWNRIHWTEDSITRSPWMADSTAGTFSARPDTDVVNTSPDFDSKWSAAHKYVRWNKKCAPDKPLPSRPMSITYSNMPQHLLILCIRNCYVARKRYVQCAWLIDINSLGLHSAIFEAPLRYGRDRSSRYKTDAIYCFDSFDSSKTWLLQILADKHYSPSNSHSSFDQHGISELSTGRIDPRVGSGHDFAGFLRVGSGQHFVFLKFFTDYFLVLNRFESSNTAFGLIAFLRYSIYNN